MKNPIEDPVVERATRSFLAVMRRACARRTPGRPNRVPHFDELGPADRLTMLNAIACTLEAARKAREDQSANTSRDTESVPSFSAS